MIIGVMIEAIYEDCGHGMAMLNTILKVLSYICAGHFVVMVDTPRPHKWNGECAAQCKHKDAAGHGDEQVTLDAHTNGCRKRL